MTQAILTCLKVSRTIRLFVSLLFVPVLLCFICLSFVNKVFVCKVTSYVYMCAYMALVNPIFSNGWQVTEAMAKDGPEKIARKGETIDLGNSVTFSGSTSLLHARLFP